MKSEAQDQSIIKRAVIYLRVSTEEQVDNYSLDTQEDICRKEALRRGYEIVMIFREEGRSAKTINGRPVLIQLIEYCRNRSNKIGAVFDPESPKDIADKINSVLSDTKRLEEIKKNVKELFNTKLNWQNEERKLIEVYKRLDEK